VKPVKPYLRSRFQGWENVATEFDGDVEVPGEARYADHILTAGLVLACGALFLHADLQRLILFAGAILACEAGRRFLFRYLYRQAQKPMKIRMPKGSIDNFRNLSYLLTTAGGFSLLANIKSELFVAVIFINVLLGVWFMDFVKHLHREEISKDGVGYYSVNLAYHRGMSYLVRAQLGLFTIALLWIAIERIA